MRLICPNCGAQYEVDDAVIPDQGRDVQCSNCGHTWFQRPAHLDSELAEELGDEAAEPVETSLEEAVRHAAEEAAETDTADEQAEEKPQRRGLDPDVAGVLREEAQREADARRAEAEGLETQPDLGLEEAEESAERSVAARARMARMRGLEDGAEAEDAGTPAGAAAATGSRKDLLPDVDEINSSLRGTDEREEEAGDGAVASPAEVRRRRSGFRTAFLLVMLVFVTGVLVYAFAPQIVAAVPESEPYMIRYVEWANGVREQVNAGLDAGIVWIQGLIGQEAST